MGLIKEIRYCLENDWRGVLYSFVLTSSLAVGIGIYLPRVTESVVKKIESRRIDSGLVSKIVSHHPTPHPHN
ncbi:MAG: hypothetical protein KKF56_05090 [Nanoarchaeota archaeon]|nr:hypothetical protein [Nanoarchaeota archaeon]